MGDVTIIKSIEDSASRQKIEDFEMTKSLFGQKVNAPAFFDSLYEAKIICESVDISGQVFDALIYLSQPLLGKAISGV